MMQAEPHTDSFAMTAPATPHILVVEDDREISALIARYLRGNDCRVTLAGDGTEMDRALAESRIDLIVLDLMLPGEDGLSLCRRLRGASQIPILMLTAKSEEVDRILGLELGADDYLAKPFNPRELLARIRAILRRVAGRGARRGRASAACTSSAGRSTSPCGRCCRPEGARIAITGAEFDLLHALCLRPGRVLSRDQLLDLTQGRTRRPVRAQHRRADLAASARRSSATRATPSSSARSAPAATCSRRR